MTSRNIRDTLDLATAFPLDLAMEPEGYVHEIEVSSNTLAAPSASRRCPLRANAEDADRAARRSRCMARSSSSCWARTYKGGGTAAPATP